MRTSCLALTLVFLACVAAAQTNCDEGAGPLNTALPAALRPADVIQTFVGNEAIFDAARKSYGYTQDLTVQTLRGIAGFGRASANRQSVSGEYRMIADVTYDGQGNRIEKVTYAPESSLRAVSMTREDFDDIQSVSGFTFMPSEVPEYDIRYAGQQHVDEIDTYAFDVSPKHIKKGRRYFEGRIWIDAHDLAIVKTCGRRVPDQHDKHKENVSPKFVTYREQINGKYWFPTYTRADEVLQFARSQTHIRETVKFTNYHPVGVAGSVLVPAAQASPAAAKKP